MREEKLEVGRILDPLLTTEASVGKKKCSLVLISSIISIGAYSIYEFIYHYDFESEKILQMNPVYYCSHHQNRFRSDV